jgi:hypothetical protein
MTVYILWVEYLAFKTEFDYLRLSITWRVRMGGMDWINLAQDRDQ